MYPFWNILDLSICLERYLGKIGGEKSRCGKSFLWDKRCELFCSSSSFSSIYPSCPCSKGHIVNDLWTPHETKRGNATYLYFSSLGAGHAELLRHLFVEQTRPQTESEERKKIIIRLSTALHNSLHLPQKYPKPMHPGHPPNHTSQEPSSPAYMYPVTSGLSPNLPSLPFLTTHPSANPANSPSPTPSKQATLTLTNPPSKPGQESTLPNDLTPHFEQNKWCALCEPNV